MNVKEAGLTGESDRDVADDPRVRRSRRAIIEAAVALFVDGGVNSVTVDAVSRSTTQ